MEELGSKKKQDKIQRTRWYIFSKTEYVDRYGWSATIYFGPYSTKTAAQNNLRECLKIQLAHPASVPPLPNYFQIYIDEGIHLENHTVFDKRKEYEAYFYDYESERPDQSASEDGR